MLGQVDDRESIGLVVEALSAKNADVRKAAITSAGDLKATEAVEALSGLTANKDATVARAAIAALGRVGGKAGSSALKALAAKPDHPARVWITTALFLAGDKASGKAFEGLLVDDDVKIRRDAVSALASLKGLETQPLYLQALKDKDASVRKVARDVLKKSKDPAVQKALGETLALEVDDLLPKLRNRQTVSAASSQLVAMGVDVVPLLMERLGTEKTAVGQDGIARTIFGLRSNKSVATTLKAGLKSKVHVVQGWSAFLLHVTSQDPTLVPTLAEFATSDFKLLNSHSVRALGRFKSKPATDALAAAIKKSSLLANTAILSLQRQDTPAAAQVLGSLLKDPKVGQRAASALKRMKTPEAKKFAKPSSTPSPSASSTPSIKDAQTAKAAAETFVELSQSGLGLKGVGKALGKSEETKATEVRVYTAGGKKLPSRFGPPLGKQNALLVKFRSVKDNVVVVVMTKNRGKYGWWDVLSIPKADFAKLKRLLPASPAKGVKVRKSPDSSSSTKKLARLYFGRLDKDKDGKLSAKEWEMAGRVRVLFEKQKIELAIPADVDKFAKAFAASRR
ncbi:MAG: HEAT repeat domain-containing protein [Planctomycetaceae bacterium]